MPSKVDRAVGGPEPSESPLAIDGVAVVKIKNNKNNNRSCERDLEVRRNTPEAVTKIVVAETGKTPSSKVSSFVG